MFSWGSFFTLIGIVGSAIAIFEFIRLRLSHRSGARPQQLALICGGVFIALFMGSIIFAPILSPAGGNERGVTSAPPSNNFQQGTGITATPPPTPSPTPSPTPTQQPSSYTANWSQGKDGW